MNHLAHLLLTEHTAEGFVGALLGDRVKGRLDGHALAPGVRRGVELHRRIDSFTDAHPAHLESRRRFSPPYRRYAGVIVDVAYDHFLAAGWARHAPGTLDAFAEQVYVALHAHSDLQPPDLRAMALRMIERDWLRGYRAPGSVALALGGIARRAPRVAALASAGPALDAAFEGLAGDFERFFPDLRAHADRLRAKGAPSTTRQDTPVDS